MKGVIMRSRPQPFLVFISLLISILVISGCHAFKSEPTPTPFIEKEEPDPFIGIPNPASFYCQEMGYLLELRDTEEGTEGICVFPDGKECEEWEFLAGKCAIEWSYCQRQGYIIREEDEWATCFFDENNFCPEYDFFIHECDPPE
jgi:putative hemolysin